MSVVEGTQLLLHRAQRLENASDDEINAAGNVVIALDHFPLALDQAGAYIEETGCGLSRYLQLYQGHRQALLARRGTQTTHYPDSVATTWSLSFQKVEQQSPAAAELLRLCAFLAPDHIPEELLIEGRDYWPPALQQATVDLFKFNQMLKELLSFSLVKRLADQQMLSLHRLVQVVQMDMMHPEEQHQWAERVVRAVNAVFPRAPRTEIDIWPQCLRYLEQTQACNTLIQRHQLLLAEAADLLERVGIYLHEHGLYTLAEPLYQQALWIWEQRSGAECPQMASLLNYLAALCSNQGNYAEAGSLFQRALQVGERQSAPDYAKMAASLDGLGTIAYKQEKYTEAELLFQQALHIREQQLGLTHPSVPYSLNGLGCIFIEQGKYAEAEPLFRQAIQIWEQQLGPEHPLVASSLDYLAETYVKQGKYVEAESLHQRSRQIQEQHLGLNHPLVAYPLHGLGNIYAHQGKYAEAEQSYQRALQIREQQLGPEHPLTAETLRDLACLYTAQHRYLDALPLAQRALAIHEHVFGPEQMKTREIRTKYLALLAVMSQEEEGAKGTSLPT